MAADASVELRGQASRTVVDMLDAISGARRVSRWELITEILQQWHDQQMREVTAVMRVTMNSNEGRR